MTAFCSDCQWLRLVFLFPGLIFLGVGAMLQRFPPKKINWFYGYRTFRSMKNQTLWDAAQRYSGRLFLRWGYVLLVIGALQAVFCSEYVVWFSLLALPVGITNVINTERYLKRVEAAMCANLPVPEE